MFRARAPERVDGQVSALTIVQVTPGWRADGTRSGRLNEYLGNRARRSTDRDTYRRIISAVCEQRGARKIVLIFLRL